MTKEVYLQIIFKPFRQKRFSYIENKVSKYIMGLYDGIKDNGKNYIAKIFVNTDKRKLENQFVTLVHELMHFAMDYFLEFKGQTEIKKFVNIDLKTEHELIEKIEKVLEAHFRENKNGK